MREVVKSYCKVVRVSGTTPVDVNFVDTSGNTLKANFAKVEAVSGGAVDGEWFLVVPSPAYTAKATSDTSSASEIEDVAGSATPGVVASTNTGSVTLSVYTGEEMTGIRLSQTEANAIRYAVTYGVVSPSNTSVSSRKASGN